MGRQFERSYRELTRIPDFLERYKYLRIGGNVGESTFGFSRYLNQVLYTSPEWRRFRRDILVRDCGRDLAFPGYEIVGGGIIVHHLNPLTLEDVEERRSCIFDPDNVVCISPSTHRAVNYGDETLLPQDPLVRRPGDTCPWKTA